VASLWAVANLVLGVLAILPLGYAITLAAYLPAAGQAHHSYVHVLGRLSPFTGLFDSDEVGSTTALALLVGAIWLAASIAAWVPLRRRLSQWRGWAFWSGVVALQLAASVVVWT